MLPWTGFLLWTEINNCRCLNILMLSSHHNEWRSKDPMKPKKVLFCQIEMSLGAHSHFWQASSPPLKLPWWSAASPDKVLGGSFPWQAALNSSRSQLFQQLSCQQFLAPTGFRISLWRVITQHVRNFLGKLFLPVQCLFYFLPSSDNAACSPFLVEGLKITSFSLYFPQELFAGSLEAHSTANKQKVSWNFLSFLPDTVSVSREDWKFDSEAGTWANQMQFYKYSFVSQSINTPILHSTVMWLSVNPHWRYTWENQA